MKYPPVKPPVPVIRLGTDISGQFLGGVTMVLKKMKYPPAKTTSSLTVLSLLVL
jgi:hypothetical protein